MRFRWDRVKNRWDKLSKLSKIGSPGEAGFGAGVYSDGILPTGFTPQPEAYASGWADNYGNYKYQDGSIMIWIPKFYYRIAHASNPTYGTYGANSVDIKGVDAYPTTTIANAAGYALHRAFIDGGSEKDGFFIDKYMCSANSYNGNTIASSVKNGSAISCYSEHNSITNLTLCSANALYETIDASKGRGTNFHVISKFQMAALALLSMAHGQASSSVTHCAWYDSTYNFPKGCNSNSLSDTNDATISYTTDGYSNCGKTGSGTPFAKTTHNGQSCGVADLNGLMSESNIGVTSIMSTCDIEAMTRANPCNVQWTEHGLNTGDYVVFGLNSIKQTDWKNFNYCVFSITRIDANNFTLDGVDSSGYAADYDSGTDPGQIHSSVFYVAKQATAMKDFTSGTTLSTDHWGATGIATKMDSFTPALETGWPNNGGDQFFGSSGNQVLAENTSGANWLLTGLGLPKDANGIDTTGTDLFGKDYFYQASLKNNMYITAGEAWSSVAYAGIYGACLYYNRDSSTSSIGFRLACYL